MRGSSPRMTNEGNVVERGHDEKGTMRFRPVIAGLDPAIHVFRAQRPKSQDARVKRGHDGSQNQKFQLNAPLKAWLSACAASSP